MILRHTLPPGRTHCQPQPADLLSHSVHVVNIGHTPVPLLCQPCLVSLPASLPLNIT